MTFLLTEGLLRCFWIVQIENDTLFVSLKFGNAAWMRPDHFARSNLVRSVQQFILKRRAKDHGVSALSLVARQHDLFLRGIKFLNKLRHKKA